MITKIDQGGYEIFDRTRLHFSLHSQKEGAIKEHLVLNEVFAGETDISFTSMFRLKVDGKELGKFKSSGILLSTGTGSSGWLYSAKMISKETVMAVQGNFGVPSNDYTEMFAE